MCASPCFLVLEINNDKLAIQALRDVILAVATAIFRTAFKRGPNLDIGQVMKAHNNLYGLLICRIELLRCTHCATLVPIFAPSHSTSVLAHTVPKDLFACSADYLL